MTANLINTAPNTSEMQEAVQGDHERIEHLFKDLMDLKIPSFVIRASLSPAELAIVNQVVDSGGPLFIEPLADLHEQARGHLESNTPHAYKQIDTYEGKKLTDVQVNNVPKGRGVGGHIDALPGRNPEAGAATDVILHTVVDGEVDVTTAGYNYVDNPDTGKIEGSLDPAHKASLTAGDSIVMRQKGTKPTHHEFITTSEERRSAIQQIKAV